MEFLVFYNAVRLGPPVEADSAVPVPARAISQDLFPLIKEDREFLGIIDSVGTTLQLVYDSDEDKYWAEVPCPEKQGSYGAALEFEQASDLLQSLPRIFPTEGFPGFKFQAW